MHDTPTATCREVILASAVAELVARGIDGFTVEGVASRAGVEARVILRMWADRRMLLIDAQLSRMHQEIPLPDTGSLRGDLLAFTAAQAELAKRPQGRAWIGRLLSASRDADLSDVRSDFWHVTFEKISTMLHRAAARGELRPGVNPVSAMQMYVAASWFDAIFLGAEVRPDYGAQTLDIFLRGITR